MRTRRGSGAVFAAVVLVAACASVPGASGAADRSVPAGFFGVVPQAPLTEGDLARMEGVVKTVRLPVVWSECEPAPGTYDFAALDAEVGAAAEHGIRAQPFVWGTPERFGPQSARPPLGRRARSAWTRFLRALVGRYGSSGTFWRGREKREPVRVWQVWNEPNFVVFWRPRPSPAGYARLLRASARAIRGADPGARVALAGLAPVNAGIKTWIFLRRLFRRPGVGRDFDLVALHPYSTTVPELDYQVRRVRRAMAEAGLGGRPLLVGEIGVASWGDFPSPFVTGPAGQATFLEASFRRLLRMRRRWRIAGVDWFTWRDQRSLDRTCSFCQGAGLLGLDGKPKPAWWAYRRAVEGTRVR
ncbi:MAG TPA: hypothetical protein VFS64_06910 [Solirubrobacterales bacterium]|nr:hypothetical protein [Solirubrobacterales bacterium]